MKLTKNNNELEFDDLEEEMDKLFVKKPKFVTRTLVKNEHIYRLDKEIKEFDQFEDLYQLLLTASGNDFIRIYINSVGGRLDIGEYIVSLIHEARARGVTVKAQLGFTVCSCATFIALACDDLEVSPFTEWMIHNWSSGVGIGNATNILRDAVYNKERSDFWFREVYAGFLSDEEIQDLIDNPRDFYLSGQQVQDRWEAMNDGSEEGGVLNFEDVVGKIVEQKLAQIESEKTTKIKKKPPVLKSSK